MYTIPQIDDKIADETRQKLFLTLKTHFDGS